LQIFCPEAVEAPFPPDEPDMFAYNEDVIVVDEDEYMNI